MFFSFCSPRQYRRDFATNLIVGRRRDADATGLGDPLKPCSDVDTVTEDVLAFRWGSLRGYPDPDTYGDTGTSALRSAIHSLHGDSRALDCVND